MKGYDVEKHTKMIIWSTFVLQKEFMKDISIRNFTITSLLLGVFGCVYCLLSSKRKKYFQSD